MVLNPLKAITNLLVSPRTRKVSGLNKDLIGKPKPIAEYTTSGLFAEEIDEPWKFSIDSSEIPEEIVIASHELPCNIPEITLTALDTISGTPSSGLYIDPASSLHRLGLDLSTRQYVRVNGLGLVIPMKTGAFLGADVWQSLCDDVKDALINRYAIRNEQDHAVARKLYEEGRFIACYVFVPVKIGHLSEYRISVGSTNHPASDRLSIDYREPRELESAFTDGLSFNPAPGVPSADYRSTDYDFPTDVLPEEDYTAQRDSSGYFADVDSDVESNVSFDMAFTVPGMDDTSSNSENLLTNNYTSVGSFQDSLKASLRRYPMEVWHSMMFVERAAEAHEQEPRQDAVELAKSLKDSEFEMRALIAEFDQDERQKLEEERERKKCESVQGMLDLIRDFERDYPSLQDSDHV